MFRGFGERDRVGDRRLRRGCHWRTVSGRRPSCRSRSCRGAGCHPRSRDCRRGPDRPGHRGCRGYPAGLRVLLGLVAPSALAGPGRPLAPLGPAAPGGPLAPGRPDWSWRTSCSSLRILLICFFCLPLRPELLLEALADADGRRGAMTSAATSATMATTVRPCRNGRVDRLNMVLVLLLEAGFQAGRGLVTAEVEGCAGAALTFSPSCPVTFASVPIRLGGFPDRGCRSLFSLLPLELPGSRNRGDPFRWLEK